jgi:hypothetical protein
VAEVLRIGLLHDSRRGGVDSLPAQSEGEKVTTQEDKFADGCMEIVNKIDQKLQEPGNEEVLEFWKDGEFDAAYDHLIKLFPEVTEEQWSWIEEFLSEL